jgi:hypothetical protein
VRSEWRVAGAGGRQVGPTAENVILLQRSGLLQQLRAFEHKGDPKVRDALLLLDCLLRISDRQLVVEVVVEGDAEAPASQCLEV